MTEVFFEFFVEHWWWIGLIVCSATFAFSSERLYRIDCIRYWAKLVCVSLYVCIIFLCGAIVGSKY